MDCWLVSGRGGRRKFPSPFPPTSFAFLTSPQLSFGEKPRIVSLALYGNAWCAGYRNDLILRPGDLLNFGSPQGPRTLFQNRVLI